MKLNELSDNPGAAKTRTRVGRGIGSGKGKTGGRGVKGQKSRSGVSIKGFEGGQMPLYRRLPKRGFTNAPFRKEFATVNLGRLQDAVDAKKLDAKKPVDAEALLAAGVISKVLDGVKILAKGELTAALTIQATKASQAAVAAVEKAGGKLELPAEVEKAPSRKRRHLAMKNRDAG
ncbi:50S ribosomal protein L15 [Hwanghaeella sp.]|uniref:50S ribosomal protein L15 n=1 Tax=Hwanghaeella sp. TaxID=2605943 RepID=UPI003CCBE68B